MRLYKINNNNNFNSPKSISKVESIYELLLKKYFLNKLIDTMKKKRKAVQLRLQNVAMVTSTSSMPCSGVTHVFHTHLINERIKS